MLQILTFVVYIVVQRPLEAHPRTEHGSLGFQLHKDWRTPQFASELKFILAREVDGVMPATTYFV